MGNYKKIRVFVACPSDMEPEKEHLNSIVKQLNDGLADHLGIVLDLKEWSQVAPDMGRSQQVIFNQLPVEKWDILIGLLWLRYGQPSGGYNPSQSGTHEEFQAAYQSWLQTGKPRIMFYRCVRPPENITQVDPDQLRKINSFFGTFETGGDNLGLYRTFTTTDEFTSLVRAHLEDVLLTYMAKEEKRSVSPDTISRYAPQPIENLPRRDAFFGREHEIKKVMDALGPNYRGWGVVIDGIGGIGKTALAIEAAYKCKEINCFDAYIFVSAKNSILDPKGIKEKEPDASTIDTFISETIRHLGLPRHIHALDNFSKREALINYLRKIKGLLIFDNLESLSANTQESLANWLNLLPPSCKAIITSRRRGGEGALWLRLEKLNWGDAQQIINSQIKIDAQLSKKLKAVEQKEWQALYDETGGSPLALIHVLGLLRVRAAFQVNDALQMLKSNEGNADLQEFVFKEAEKELTYYDVQVLQALSFFSPSATFEAIMSTANLSRAALETSLDRLNALSLVRVNIQIEKEKYTLHPLTRCYIKTKLFDVDRINYTVGIRFANYWLNYTKQYGGWGKEAYKTFDYLENEWGNLYTSANWLWDELASEHSQTENEELSRILTSFIGKLSTFLSFSGRWDEYIRLNEQAYEATKNLDTLRDTGWRAFDLAWINYKRANTEESRNWLEKCTTAWEHGGTKGDKATALRLKGLLAQQDKDYKSAEIHLKEALVIRQELAVDREVAFILRSLGQLAQEQKEYDKASEYYQKVFAIGQNTEDKAMQASINEYLGTLALEQERIDDAYHFFRETLRFAEELGRVELRARAQHGLALVFEDKQNLSEAIKFAKDAYENYKILNHADFLSIQSLVEHLEKLTIKQNAGKTVN